MPSTQGGQRILRQIGGTQRLRDRNDDGSDGGENADDRSNELQGDCEAEELSNEFAHRRWVSRVDTERLSQANEQRADRFGDDLDALTKAPRELAKLGRVVLQLSRIAECVSHQLGPVLEAETLDEALEDCLDVPPEEILVEL